MSSPAEQQLAEILTSAAAELDISDELDERLTAAYTDLGEWLKIDNEELYTTDSEVYPQGSRLLGTLTAPSKPNDDCDLDLVYRRNLKRISTTQRELKEQAGEQLRRYVLDLGRRGMRVPTLTEGSRCWTLQYDEFHMDVLPALPDDSITSESPRILQDAIIITDRSLRHWQNSNPKGYARWFRKRMASALNERRTLLGKTAEVTVETIPEDAVKTPLQRAVQLLKRHRDIWYAGHPDDKPISIIITTLSAHAYQGETDVLAAVQGLTSRMDRFIQSKNGNLWVPNPTNPDENFADKWELFPVRAEQFGKWLVAVRFNLEVALNQRGLDKVATVLSDGFGKTIVEGAMRRYGSSMQSQRNSGALRASSGSATLGAIGALQVPRHTFHGHGR